MNKIKIFKSGLLVAGVALLGLASCTKKFIDKNPNDSLAPGIALGDATQLGVALNGAYAELRSVSLWGRDFEITGDLSADNTFVEVKNSGRYLNQFNYNFTSADGVVEGDWTAAYAGILRCNNIIDATVTGADDIKAQALGIRAALYLKLIMLYARPYTDNPDALGVPLILHYSPSFLPTRATVKAVYTQIVTDLKTAMTTAPAYSLSTLISKYAIEGLLARAYFYMGDYTDAKTAALDVINNGGFKLANTLTAYKAFWGNPAGKSDQVEVLFEVEEDPVNNLSSDDLGGMYYGGYQDVYASQQLVSLYSPTDIRASLLMAGNTKSGAPATIVTKYPNATNADKDNPKVIRLAELYLIAAESSLPANEPDALKYLNLLMAARDPSTTYASTGAQLLSDIVTERRKELAFEGDRLYDLNRLKMDINRGATLNLGSIPGLATIPYSDYRRIMAVPLNEIQSNANIAGQQNPGYK
ncbi:MAG TPA: RagB/SusD family nutrient uptake outer membrane protein [Puia sp.]|jgi:hypothetical protein